MTTAPVYDSPQTSTDETADRLRALVNRLRTRLDGTELAAAKRRDGASELPSEQHEEQQKPAAPTQCQRLANSFGLSAFELDMVLLCAAAELDLETSDLCAALHNDSRISHPTFQLAMHVLPEAHWAALLPDGPLRRRSLVEIEKGELLMTARLSIAEPVLHFLMGAPCIDARLGGLLEPIDPPRVLPSCYQSVTERLVLLLLQDAKAQVTAHLCGNATHSKRHVAAAACAALGLHLYGIAASCLSSPLENLPRLLERDAALVGFALLVEMDGATPPERATAALFAETFAGKLIVCGGAGLDQRRRPVEKLTINRPAPADQHALWAFALGNDADVFNGHLDRVSAQFSLDCETILRAGAALRRHIGNVEVSGHGAGALLLEFCRAGARSALGELSQHIEAKADWPALVLPESSLEVLRALSAQVRQQGKVLESWGFARQTSRGLGISALFHGLSGTGKTLAAEVLARDLNLDLFRIDLSQMVSKYVGETEKNLRSIFDAAENSGAILLFDEADALFGKRSEVRDSHDRYANIEVSYLLQRIESYRGLAILTTNMRGALDAAFLRRISFFVSFPFPDQQLRKSIWERMFPPAMPFEALDFDKLSRLNLPGGNIRNIAVNAAYIAADRDEPVRMEHLLIAARRECAKIERPLTTAETGGWV